MTEEKIDSIIELAKKHVVELLTELSDEERQKIFRQFCRNCCTYLNGEKDWSGRNYCYMCSPDPRD